MKIVTLSKPMVVSVEVFEAAQRILSKGNDYPDLKFTGNKESAEKFSSDVLKIAEFIAELACKIEESQKAAN